MRLLPRLAALAAVTLLGVAGCATTTPSDAAPSDAAPTSLDPSPSAVDPAPSDGATPEPTPSPGGALDPDPSSQYVHAFCGALVLEQSLELQLGDDQAVLGPARTTTAAAVLDGAEILLADWVAWSDASLETRTRLAADLQTYGEALLTADVTAVALWPVVTTSPLDGTDSATLRFEVGLNPDLEVACAGG